MNSNTEKFLKEIGVTGDAIDQLKGEDDIEVKDLSDGFKTSFKDVFINNPEVINPLKKEIQGKELSQIEHKIKKAFGLTSEEIKDKKFDEIIVLAIDKLRGEKTDVNETLQNDLIELRSKVKEFEDKIIPDIQTKGQTKLSDYKKEMKIRKILNKKSLIVDSEILYPSVQSYLDKNYSIGLGDDDALQIKTKDGLNPLDKEGTTVQTLDQIVDGYLNEMKVIKQSNGDVDNTSKAVFKTLNVKNQSEVENKFHLPHLQKAKENAERLKEMKTHGGLTSL